ncbi:unnamed protein product [Amoebophrya sp. A25]|nr:unnamed protein product [Amoebophrya sp. A25]|eukprot:GSA25T00024577001.1
MSTGSQEAAGRRIVSDVQRMISDMQRRLDVLSLYVETNMLNWNQAGTLLALENGAGGGMNQQAAVNGVSPGTGDVFTPQSHGGFANRDGVLPQASQSSMQSVSGSPQRGASQGSAPSQTASIFGTTTRMTGNATSSAYCPAEQRDVDASGASSSSSSSTGTSLPSNSALGGGGNLCGFGYGGVGFGIGDAGTAATTGGAGGGELTWGEVMLKTIHKVPIPTKPLTVCESEELLTREMGEFLVRHKGNRDDQMNERQAEWRGKVHNKMVRIFYFNQINVVDTRLNNWERGFLGSVRIKNDLSEKQEKSLWQCFFRLLGPQLCHPAHIQPPNPNNNPYART